MKDNKSSIQRKKITLVILISAILLITLGFVGHQIFTGSDKRLSRAKQRGSEYLLKENYEGAKEEFKKAVELAPTDLVLYFQLAEAFIGLEDYIDAAAYLEQAITMAEQKPLEVSQYTSLTIKLAECYSKTGEDRKRASLLKRSLELTGSDRIMELMEDYYPEPVISDLPEGEYNVEDVLTIGFIGAGTIYYTLDQTEPSDTSAQYAEVLALPPGTYEIRAVAVNEFGFQSEVASFSYTIKPIDYLARGSEKVLLKDYDGAMEDFLRVIRGNEKEVAGYYGMARVYIAKNEFENAIKAVNIGLSHGDNRELSELQAILVPTVETSLEPGVYSSDREIKVELKGNGTDIYYTLDGSLPTVTSPVYEGPISLRKGANTITAASVSVYGTFGKVMSFEYAINYKETSSEASKENEKSSSGGKSSLNSEKADNSKKTEEKLPASEQASEEKEEASVSEQQATADEKGNIIWTDPNVEAAVRKLLGKAEGAITVKEAGTIDGILDLSGTDINSLADLVWLKRFSTLSCRGEDLTNAEFINSLQASRVIAVYRNLDEVKAIDNTEVLKELKNFGICVADFSLGNMSVFQMMEFFSEMNQIMQKLTNLEYLDLSNNGLTDISMIGAISNISKIKILKLQNNGITDISVLKNFTNLIYLDVTGNDIADFTPVKHVGTVVRK